MNEKELPQFTRFFVSLSSLTCADLTHLKMLINSFDSPIYPYRHQLEFTVNSNKKTSAIKLLLT